MLLDVVEYGQALGLDMSYGDHEDAPGQLELNFRFDRPVKTADNITTYRQICAAVGRKHGLLPTLHAEAVHGRLGQRAPPPLHAGRRGGQQRLPRPRRARRSSPTSARHFLGGMLDHFGALMCVGNPTVNSYCRMWDFGFWAPVYKNWGWQNRTCTVRVASGRPLRVPRRGLVLQPVPDRRRRCWSPAWTASSASSTRASPSSANTYDLLQEANGEQPLERVPDSLGDALDALGKRRGRARRRHARAASTRSSTTTSATSGSATWPRSPTGSATSTWRCCP